MIELFQVGDAVSVATQTGTWSGYIDRIEGREFWVRIDRPVPLLIKSDRSGINRFGVTIKRIQSDEICAITEPRVNGTVRSTTPSDLAS